MKKIGVAPFMSYNFMVDNVTIALAISNRIFEKSSVGEFSLRLVSQGDLPAANSRSNTPPACYSLPSRRFATPPLQKRMMLYQNHRCVIFDYFLPAHTDSIFFKTDDQWSPLQSNKEGSPYVRRVDEVKNSFVETGGDSLSTVREEKSVCFAYGYISIAV